MLEGFISNRLVLLCHIEIQLRSDVFELFMIRIVTGSNVGLVKTEKKKKPQREFQTRENETRRSDYQLFRQAENCIFFLTNPKQTNSYDCGVFFNCLRNQTSF